MALRAGALPRSQGPTLSPQQKADLKALLAEPQPELPETPVEIVRRHINPELPGWTQWLDVVTANDNSPVRHRVAYGGRGASKTRSFATKLLLRGLARVERILCTREFQRSIRDSVHRVLVDEINRLGLGVLGSGHYIVTDREIRGANGTLFIFAGLHRNENGIKSLEGVTVAWVEEAQTVSQTSIDALIPTIRIEGSEIWWSYNPRFATDPVDAMFRPKDNRPPPGTVLIPVNYYDNPFFPEVLRRQMEYDRGRDPDKYAHIWRGAYLQRSEAKVFRNWKVRPFEVPEGAVVRHGVDWGFSVDPSVIISCFIGSWSGEAWESDPVPDHDGKVLFVRHEAYEVGCPVEQLPALFAGNDNEQPPRWKNPRGLEGIPNAQLWKIIADSARPELIDYCARRGFYMEPAKKGPNSVQEGVTFLQSYDICVHPSCIHTIDELTFYEFETDKLTGEVLPKLKDKKNHVIDALRYALENVRLAGSGRMDFAAEPERVTVAAAEGRGPSLVEQQMKESLTTTPEPANSGGWGALPGLGGGLL
jgi:phage terminase large subunit